MHAYRAKIQSRFSRKQSHKLNILILYFRLLFSRRITPFPLVPPVTNHPVYYILIVVLYSRLCKMLSLCNVYLITLLIFVVSMIAKSTKELQSSESCCYATRVDSSSSDTQIRSLFLSLRFESVHFLKVEMESTKMYVHFTNENHCGEDRCRRRRSRTQRRENGQAQWTPGTFSCRVQLAWRIISTYYSRVAYKKGTDSSDDTRQSWYGQKPQPTIYRIIPRTKSGEYLDVDSGKASTIATAFVRVISSRDNRIFSICFETEELDMYRLS